MDYSVEMIGIRKEYGQLIANNDVTVRIEKGSVMCLVGENGAGKSTLMNILYGLEQPTSGEIKICGETVHFSSSRDAIKKKIGMVHQHFMLVDELSVLENIILGMEPKRGISLDYKKARSQVAELSAKYGMQVPLDARAGELAVGIQQKVEIVKILYRGADILIFDEPTAVLTPQETQELFSNIRLLAASGKTVILITHHLDEVMQIANDIVVIRRGTVVSALKAQETNVTDLAEHMVGKALPQMKERKDNSSSKAELVLSGITVLGEHGLPVLKNVSLQVNQGEVLGVAGVSGNGQSELAQVIAGLVKARTGAVRLEAEDITQHTRRERLLDGISYIPENRTTDGLCLPWSIAENTVAGYHIRADVCKRFGLLDQKKIGEIAERIITNFDVRTPSAQVNVGSLSGGNQQKVVVGRETINDPKLIVAAEPTRGVDVGAISFIHNYLIDLRNNGTSILLISSDLDEVFKLSDRIVVLYEGEIVLTVCPQDITREELGLYMAGSKRSDCGNAG